jgi:hypothetical protein
VALEASGPALAIARILKPHVTRVVIANTRKVRAIAEAKVKTDKVDAATLCELLESLASEGPNPCRPLGRGKVRRIGPVACRDRCLHLTPTGKEEQGAAKAK